MGTYICIIIAIIIFILWQLHNKTKITIKSLKNANNKLGENNRKLSRTNTEIRQKYNDLRNNLTHIARMQGKFILTLNNTNDDFLLLNQIDSTYVLYDPMLSSYKVGLINFSNSLSGIDNPESIILYLNDIQITPGRHDKGYGTILLEHLFDYATLKGFKQIKGELARIDAGHHKKLIHFYQKNGFEVVMGKNQTGRITRIL